MRLIDADALPYSWQSDCNGNREFVTKDDIAAAPTESCDACERTAAVEEALCDAIESIAYAMMDVEDADAIVRTLRHHFERRQP